jgi:GNAT superfamily N-acetyltransferase
MSSPGTKRLLEVMEATWPPAATRREGLWLLRDGAGGGKRVSAATLAEGGPEAADPTRAEAAMRAAGETPLFMLRPGEETLDHALEARGYRVVDPVVAYAAPVATLIAHRPERRTAHIIWPPVAIMREIWAAGGIGPARLAVMDRARGPKTAIFERLGYKPGGVAFVACDGDHAMLHALEVQEDRRRGGVARRIMVAAAEWAQEVGAQTLSVMVTRANAPACALYESLGMEAAAGYHYRQAPSEPAATLSAGAAAAG